jgi:hypothetical protein
MKHEIRYKVTVPNFFTLTNKNSIDQRIDWYFPEYRIRHSEKKGPDGEFSTWYKIYNTESGQAVKLKIEIEKPSARELDKALFKLVIYSKRPRIDGIELYLEQVHIYEGSKFIATFIATEAENESDVERVQMLEKIPGCKVQEIGQKPLRKIVQDIINSLKT